MYRSGARPLSHLEFSQCLTASGSTKTCPAGQRGARGRTAPAHIAAALTQQERTSDNDPTVCEPRQCSSTGQKPRLPVEGPNCAPTERLPRPGSSSSRINGSNCPLNRKHDLKKCCALLSIWTEGLREGSAVAELESPL